MSSTSTEDEIHGIEIRAETWTKFHSEIIDNYLAMVRRNSHSLELCTQKITKISIWEEFVNLYKC